MRGERLAFGFFLMIVVAGIFLLAIFGGTWDKHTLVASLLAGGAVVGGLMLAPPWSKREGIGGGPNAPQWVFMILGFGMWCANPVCLYLASGKNIGAAVGSGRDRFSVMTLAYLAGLAAVFLAVILVRQVRGVKAAKRQRSAWTGSTPQLDQAPVWDAPGESQVQPWHGPGRQPEQLWGRPPQQPSSPRTAPRDQQRRPW